MGLRTVSHYRFAKKQTSASRTIHFAQVLWSIEGTGWIRINGTDHALEQDHAAIYLPGMQHFYHAGDSEWELRCLTFDGIAAASVIQGFGIDTSRPFKAGKCPAGIFDSMAAAVGESSAKALRKNSAMIYSLLADIADRYHTHGGAEKSGAIAVEAIRLMNENMGDAQIGIEQIAGMLGLSRFAFSKKFREETGTPPKAYLQELRLQRIMSLISQPRFTLAEIAAQTGFLSDKSMSRFFLLLTGVRPSHFRTGKS